MHPFKLPGRNRPRCDGVRGIDKLFRTLWKQHLEVMHRLRGTVAGVQDIAALGVRLPFIPPVADRLLEFERPAVLQARVDFFRFLWRHRWGGINHDDRGVGRAA
jgi:hypothetical protein